MVRLTIIFGGNNDVRAVIPFRGAKQAQAATTSFGTWRESCYIKTLYTEIYMRYQYYK
jgi:hypothetical protein